jgi:hypothetical protein
MTRLHIGLISRTMALRSTPRRWRPSPSLPRTPVRLRMGDRPPDRPRRAGRRVRDVSPSRSSRWGFSLRGRNGSSSGSPRSSCHSGIRSSRQAARVARLLSGGRIVTAVTQVGSSRSSRLLGADFEGRGSHARTSGSTLLGRSSTRCRAGFATSTEHLFGRRVARTRPRATRRARAVGRGACRGADASARSAHRCLAPVALNPRRARADGGPSSASAAPMGASCSGSARTLADERARRDRRARAPRARGPARVAGRAPSRLRRRRRRRVRRET